MDTWKIVWHWIDEDGYIRSKVVFSADNEEVVLKEWRQQIRLGTYGWYDIVKEVSAE